MARLPTLENCQPAEGEEPDPSKIFQWAFVALPFVGSTPLLIQPKAREQWSKLFWDMGFRHFPELMTKKVVSPHRGQQHALNGAVRIVDADEPDKEPVTIPDPLAYTAHEQQVMAERLYYSGALGERVPKSRMTGAEVTGEMFNPSDHPVATVLGYLMGPVSDAEKRRVIAAEMADKHRPGILNKHRGV